MLLKRHPTNALKAELLRKLNHYQHKSDRGCGASLNPLFGSNMNFFCDRRGLSMRIVPPQIN